MSDSQVFKSTHPVVLAAVRDGERSRREAVAGMEAWAVDNDPDGAGRKPMIFGGSRVSLGGLIATEQDEHHPPKGWRCVWRGVRYRVLVPDRRYKDGRRRATEMDEFTVPRWPDLPGMPRDSWTPRTGGGFDVHLPSSGEIDGVVYARWHGDADLSADRMMSDGRTVDPSLWEPCRLSEFYAAVEQQAGEA